ncbi:CdaR family transcriptional regulator [Nocardia sp. XZ_19_231]|uniref:PucR family transcriptional regulator n=1 Tax=Nocardia sp. XZ_19_231 TaxID=2769252 RepID=UPI0018902D91|nr:helix-turn-helix domain-containing protein [Nocardia sp. XZ_19_231]
MSPTQLESPASPPRATQHIVDGILSAIPPRSIQGNVLREEIRAVVVEYLEQAGGARTLDSRAALHPAAARWAATGVPIETVQRLVHTGFQLHLNDNATKLLRHNNINHIMDAMHTVNSTVSKAYLEVASSATQRNGHQAVARALLRGRHATSVARECGIPLTDQYTVLAVAADNSARGAVSPGSFLEMLSARVEQPMSALHSDLGGTILIQGCPDTKEIGELVRRTALVVVAIEVDRDRIPSATEDGHELLDVVRRLHRPPGLYHFDDLAIEYQLTRPGPGRDRLETALDAVSADPELVATLRAHINNGLNRRLTARDMHIHQNTVDYRLKRIYRLARLDSHDPGLIWKLRAALTVREYLGLEEHKREPVTHAE